MIKNKLESLNSSKFANFKIGTLSGRNELKQSYKHINTGGTIGGTNWAVSGETTAGGNIFGGYSPMISDSDFRGTYTLDGKTDTGTWHHWPSEEWH